ncbi:MAG: glycerophosphodiester phosphodiesterase [Acidobacteriota bacterium]
MRAHHRGEARFRSTFALSILLALAALWPATNNLPTANAKPASGTSRPLVIAHRGGALESTENTIAAFQRAVKIGADGIETDIRLTRDGVVVVYHDQYFGRMEGLAPPQCTRLVSDLTYSELIKQTLVPVGEDLGGRRVPTLSELLSSVQSGLLNIELKRCDRFNDLVNKTIAILKPFPALDRVVLEAPGLDTAKKLRKGLGSHLKLHINPEYDGTVSLPESLKRALKFKPHSISVSYKKISREIVELAHKAGVEVWTWTVNAPETAQAMALMGVDAIKTDRPTMLLDLLRKQNGN